MRANHLKILLILATIGVSVWQLLPTFRYAQMTPEERLADPAAAEELRSEAITLGLDLQGGIHMVLGIKTDKLRFNVLQNAQRRAVGLFNEKGLAVIGSRVAPDGWGVMVDVNPSAADRADAVEEITQRVEFLDPPARLTDPAQPERVTLHFPINAARFEREVSDATSRALEIIRNRIDAFGVAEPSIHEAGDGKIVVELPGASDPRRARELIGRTAQLQFHRVREDRELLAALTAIDQALGGALLKEISSRQIAQDRYDIHLSDPARKEEVRQMLERPDARRLLPAGGAIHFGTPERREAEGRMVLPLYLLVAQEEMTGEDLQSAHVFYNERNQPAVSFEFNDRGAKEFGRLTAELMQGQRRLAVVLDGVVQSAPSVKSMITRRGQIEGNFSVSEASDLAVVLRSGALPAPVEILEDRTVGPSLGRDSIQKGIHAAAVALLVIIGFMILRYKASGVNASFALLLNLFFLLAALASFGATLTLPGIAGIVLSLGMAVDSNILIYERIREELKQGRSAMMAIRAGFEKAFGTILDANLTTLVTAAMLYEFGTGPIRGFAVTLSIGIVCSMFTAVFVSRVVFDNTVLARREPRISI